MATDILVDVGVTKKLEFRLKLLKDEIAAQSNTFDQIDSKTGVALGFTFIVVGQVLASVFRMATNPSKLSSAHPHLTGAGFWLANALAFAAILSGIVARWPRSFQNAVSFNSEQLNASYEEMVALTVSDLEKITASNDETNTSKGFWAMWTYGLVGASLVTYLVLTMLVYFYAVPKG